MYYSGGILVLFPRPVSNDTPLAVSIWEIQISVTALDLHLRNMEEL